MSPVVLPRLFPYFEIRHISVLFLLHINDMPDNINISAYLLLRLANIQMVQEILTLVVTMPIQSTIANTCLL